MYLWENKIIKVHDRVNPCIHVIVCEYVCAWTQVSVPVRTCLWQRERVRFKESEICEQVSEWIIEWMGESEWMGEWVSAWSIL